MFSKLTHKNEWWYYKRPNIAFFLGYDIKEATKYKIDNEDTWMFDINSQLDKIEQVVKNEFYNSVDIQTWKRLGDEIIFCLLPRNKEDLINIYKKCFSLFEKKKQYETEFKLKLRLFCAGYHYLNEPLTIDDTKQRSDIEKYKELKMGAFNNYRINHIVPFENNTIKEHSLEFPLGQVIEYDFIGPDIDIGFRISEFADDLKFLISDRVAYIVSKYKIQDFEINIEGDKELKGVWNQKPYPRIYLVRGCVMNDEILTSVYSDIEVLKNQEYFLELLNNVLSRDSNTFS